jgi:iron(III) transport system substrate-binding protein
MIKPSKHYCRWLIPLWLSVLAGCWSAPDRQVVVYTALDREFSEPILQDFEQRTGIRVLAKYDVESTKTVGLVNAIIQERNRPRCDLFWNNEILHTLRLERLGMLDRYESPRAADFP